MWQTVKSIIRESCACLRDRRNDTTGIPFMSVVEPPKHNDLVVATEARVSRVHSPVAILVQLSERSTWSQVCVWPHEGSRSFRHLVPTTATSEVKCRVTLTTTILTYCVQHAPCASWKYFADLELPNIVREKTVQVGRHVHVDHIVHDIKNIRY